MRAWIIGPLEDHRIRKAIGAAAVTAALVAPTLIPTNAVGMHARHNHNAHHSH